MLSYALAELTYYYPQQTQPALEQVDLEVNAGEFLLVLGAAGAGKSTLARVLAKLVPDFYGGKISGRRLFRTRPLAQWSAADFYRQVGFIYQNPETQLLFDQVEKDIAFGLENLGYPPDLIQRRIAEVLDHLGIKALRSRRVSTLSGGEKQKVNLASVLAVRPEIIILDEPTSHLDPIAAQDLLVLLRKLNQEMGITIVLIENEVNNCFDGADRIAFLDQGKLVFAGLPQRFLDWAQLEQEAFIPIIPRLFLSVRDEKAPVTIKQGRTKLKSIWKKTSSPVPEPKPISYSGGLELKHLGYKYPGTSIYALEQINLLLSRGELVALTGGNGAGKTTLLKVLAGLLSVVNGKIRGLSEYKPGYLPASTQEFFLTEQLGQEFTVLNQADSIDNWPDRLDVTGFMPGNPRQLSLGEQKRAALAVVLAADPDLILLDEPTAGMDETGKNMVGTILQEICAQGKTVVMVSHDMDFVADYAPRMVFMDQGRILADGPTAQIMVGNTFYTSRVARLFNGIDDMLIRQSDARRALCEVRSALN